MADYGTGGLWNTTTLGGYLHNPHLSKQLRHFAGPLMKFRQFVQIKEAFGLGRSETVYFDKVSKIGTAGTALTENTEIPEHRFVLTRGTITITEYGNAIPYSGKLEAIAEFDVDNAITRVLRDDMASALDQQAAAEFTGVEYEYVCAGTALGSAGTSWTVSTGTAYATAQANLNAYHVKEIVDTLKKMNAPKYDGENYICIASVNAMRGIKDHSDWTDAAKYGDPERLFSGEVGRFYGCRFIEETNFLVNTLGGSTFGEAVFFGGDAVMEGIAIPEEVRAAIPRDYGRRKGVAWYALLGWKRIWDMTSDGISHIIHVTEGTATS